MFEEKVSISEVGQQGKHENQGLTKFIDWLALNQDLNQNERRHTT